MLPCSGRTSSSDGPGRSRSASGTFWEYQYPGAFRAFLTRWFWRATPSRLKPMAAAAKLVQRHLPNPLTYQRHRVTNAGLEGLNAVIQGAKKTAQGVPQRRALQDGHLLPLRASTSTHTKAGRFFVYLPRRPGRGVHSCRLTSS